MSEHRGENERHLSVVVTSRNDEHGGDLTKRMQLFLDGLAAQANRHRVPLELIMVEWNPPSDRAGLAEHLRWPPATEFFSARVVVVPARIHAKLDPGGALPLFQMIAKNVGIRRARGRYVLATNVDLLFPDELFRTIRDGLRDGVIFRSNRLDVSREIPSEGPIEKLLDFCRAHVIRLHRATGTYVRKHGRWKNTSPSALSACAAYTRFFLNERFRDHPAMRRVVLPLLSKAQDSNRAIQVAAGIAGLTAGAALGGYLRVRWYGAPSTRRRFAYHANQLAAVYRVNRKFVRLHTNGCGDFTLLDRDTWLRLRGYPEWPVFSWGIDSILLFQADANHVAIEKLPSRQCTYHVDHGGGWTPEEYAALFRRLAEKGITVLSEQDFYRLEVEMEERKRQRAPLVYNPGNWGLADEYLSELVPSRAGSAR
jgi:hypothetical protein